MPICPLQVWLKQPLTAEEDIRVRHDVVEAIVGDPELREGLRDHHFRGQLTTLEAVHCGDILP